MKGSWIVASLLAILSVCSEAAPVAYTDQTEFLNGLAALGQTAIHEGFEDDGAWGEVRSPNTAPSITHLGVTWTRTISPAR